LALAKRILKTTRLLTYLDSRVWSSAVEDQIARILGENLEQKRILIAGDHPKSRLLAANLAERRARVCILSKHSVDLTSSLRAFSFSPSSIMLSHHQLGEQGTADLLGSARMVVVWPGGASWFGEAEAEGLGPGTCVLDAAIGGLLPKAIESLRKRNLHLIRQNMWPTLAGVLLAAEESHYACNKSMGRTNIAGISVVAGGELGQPGDVVVDSVTEPSRVIGIADPFGGIAFKYAPQEKQRVDRVTQEINLRLVKPRGVPTE
jgi:hypothetical protein